MSSPSLPKSLEAAVEQARQAAQTALDDGYQRLKVELLFPELKVMPVAQSFLVPFEPLGEALRVVFPDAGAAALARRDWGDKPFAIRGISDVNAGFQAEERLFVFVEPSAVEVGQVEALCTAAGDRPVVMFNPSLEDVAVVGIGYAARQIRERFLSQFESCYHLRPLNEAALFRCYPHPWQVWRQVGDDYELAGDWDHRPTSEEIDQQLMGTLESNGKPSPTKRSFLGELQSFLRALSQ
ncbi:MAG: DUF1995 family protein [Cyanobacteria bacterium P01_A01_bin.135]